MKVGGFAKYCWGTLGYTVLVIMWGAFVRATGSGAGCGSHWPTCNGQVLPRSPSAETLIEFTHRASSGILGLLALALLVGAFKRFPAGHRVRAGAWATMALIVAEALIGAGIVKFEWVAENDSLARVITIGFHLANTFLLLAALALTAWWASGGPAFRWRGSGAAGGVLLATMGGMLLIGASGAVTALGDTLLLTSGIGPEDSPMVAALVSLRFVHPMLALLLVIPVTAAARICKAASRHPWTRRLAYSMLVVFHFQLLLGVVNVFLQAPVWAQMTHLLLADALWIILVLLAASTLSEAAGRPPKRPPVAYNEPR